MVAIFMERILEKLKTCVTCSIYPLLFTGVIAIDVATSKNINGYNVRHNLNYTEVGKYGLVGAFELMDSDNEGTIDTKKGFVLRTKSALF